MTKTKSPFMTAEEATKYLRMPSVKAFYQARLRCRWHHGQEIGSRAGRKLLFTADDLKLMLKRSPRRGV